jgi:hypothetical protein
MTQASKNTTVAAPLSTQKRRRNLKSMRDRNTPARRRVPGGEAVLRDVIRAAARTNGAAWLQAVLDKCGAERIGVLKGPPLRIAAAALVRVAASDISAAYAETAALRSAVRSAAQHNGALWLRAVLNACGVQRMDEMAGEPLRIAAEVLVGVGTADVSAAYEETVAARRN